MTVKINLIRHGLTAGNLKKRYIGTTDEPLCPEGVSRLAGVNYGTADVWFLSPMKRCLETASILEENFYQALRKKQTLEKEQMSGKEQISGRKHKIIVPDFRECDFGLFENKNYLELSDCQEYQQWIDSGGKLPFPLGEAAEDFKERCCCAFEKIVEQIFRSDWQTVNMVVHGGTIMSIMERYARPEKGYYEWHVENGCGYRVCLEEKTWTEQKCFEAYVPLNGKTGKQEETNDCLFEG